MMPPGHVAATWAVSHLLQKDRVDQMRLDYRLLALSALAPDLIDKPLALLVFTEAQTSQLVAHSLIPNLILFVLTLLIWRQALPYVLTFNLHLVADRMWNHTETFWWPLFGWDVFWQFKPMNTPEVMFNVYVEIITRYPQVWIVEIVALLYLIWFAVRFQLYRWSALKHFALSGQVSPLEESDPIGTPAVAALQAHDKHRNGRLMN
jgi:hypothetical protein